MQINAAVVTMRLPRFIGEICTCHVSLMSSSGMANLGRDVLDPKRFESSH